MKAAAPASPLGPEGLALAGGAPPGAGTAETLLSQTSPHDAHARTGAKLPDFIGIARCQRDSGSSRRWLCSLRRSPSIPEPALARGEGTRRRYMRSPPQHRAALHSTNPSSGSTARASGTPRSSASSAMRTPSLVSSAPSCSHKTSGPFRPQQPPPERSGRHQLLAIALSRGAILLRPADAFSLRR